MKHYIKRCALLMTSASMLASYSATAANSFYAPGDLVLFFQKEGSSNTIYASLGNAANLYRGAATGTIGQESLTRGGILNLNTTLTSAFGAGWASDTGIYAGVAGVFGASPSSATLSNLDPQRTLYISRSRDSVGTVGTANSTQWDLQLAGNTAMTSAATGIKQQNDVLENSYTTQVALSTTDVSQIDDMNPFLAPGIQGNAMSGALEGGIQQRGTAGNVGTYDGVGNVEFALDIYRVLARNTIPGQLGGDLRQGSFEGTVTIGSNGSVSYLVPEPSSIALVGLAAGALVLRRRRNA